TTRPRGTPPTPSATSSWIAPVGMTSTCSLAWCSPSFMMEPLPNCFSICVRARSRLRCRSFIVAPPGRSRLIRGGSAPNSLALSIPNIRSHVNQPRESAHFTEPDFLDLAVDRARGVKSALHDKQRLDGLGSHRHPAQLLEDRRQIGRGPRSPDPGHRELGREG